jgi:hypothetical protein
MMRTELLRRDFLRLSAAGAVTAAGVPWFHTMARAAGNAPKPKACILLWMDGGASQAHTFDPKPNGEYASIETAVPGIRVTDCLPKMAAQMKDVALLRSMTTTEGDHYRAKYLMHTGYSRLGGFEHPALGCIASSESLRPANEMPGFVTIDAGFDKGNGGRLYRSVPSYLGVKHTPLAVSDPYKGLENLGTADEEFEDQLALLMKSEKRFAAELEAAPVQAKQAAFDRALAPSTSTANRRRCATPTASTSSAAPASWPAASSNRAPRSSRSSTAAGTTTAAPARKSRSAANGSTPPWPRSSRTSRTAACSIPH